jgi:hypothetical protein
MDSVSLQGTNNALTDRKNGLEAEYKGLEVLKRLQHEVAEAQAERLSGLEKLDAEEREEIRLLTAEGEYNARTAPLVAQKYDAKRLAEYNREMKRLDELMDHESKRFAEMSMQAAKAFSAEGEDVKRAQENLKRYNEEIEKLVKEYNKLTDAKGQQELQHRVAMVAAGGGDPLAVLGRQQAIEKADIEERYQNTLKSTNNVLERANALRERNLQLQRLQYQMEEASETLRQRGVRDFFREMQERSQSAGNILYNAMHDALDRTSGELARLFTGQPRTSGRCSRGSAKA